MARSIRAGFDKACHGRLADRHGKFEVCRGKPK
jgi:hypothetical protein